MMVGSCWLESLWVMIRLRRVVTRVMQHLEMEVDHHVLCGFQELIV